MPDNPIITKYTWDENSITNVNAPATDKATGSAQEGEDAPVLSAEDEAILDNIWDRISLKKGSSTNG